mgnify:CR=1 FL=1
MPYFSQRFCQWVLSGYAVFRRHKPFKISENVYNQLNHMNLDRAIFKSGTPVVEPEMLDMFNVSIISIEHAF